MKISIIIPFYNSEKTLRRCVESLISQKNVDVEIIMVNDASNDSSLDICKSYTQIDDRITILNNSNKGVSNARNVGLEHCSGDIVTFCDADDYYSDDVLEKVLTFFEKNDNCDLLITGFNVINHGVISGRQASRNKINRIDEYKLVPMFLNNPRVMGAVWNKFFKKDLIGKIRFEPSISFGEDICFCTQYVKNNCGLNTWILPLITYNYWQHEESVTRNIDLLFDMNDELKYYECFSLLNREYKLSNLEIDEVRCAKARISLNTIKNFELNDIRREKAILEIKKNLFYFVRYGYVVGVRTYFKMLKDMIKILS